MAITTYSELQTAISNWLDRPDLASIIPDFIALAEAKFNRRLRTMEMENRATTETIAGQTFYSLPDDALAITNIQLNTDPKTVLERYTKEQIDREYATGTGQPRVFTLNANQIELAPSPDSNYELEISYYEEIPALSDENTTNWLLDQAPDLYLYGAMMEAAPYIKDTNAMTVWTQKYEATLQRIMDMDLEDKWSTGPLTSIPG